MSNGRVSYTYWRRDHGSRRIRGGAQAPWQAQEGPGLPPESLPAWGDGRAGRPLRRGGGRRDLPDAEDANRGDSGSAGGRAQEAWISEVAGPLRALGATRSGSGTGTGATPHRSLDRAT